MSALQVKQYVEAAASLMRPQLAQLQYETSESMQLLH
jgi:hypothetical protein